MFGIGGTEIIVILIVALIFVGPDKLPEAAKSISKGIRDLKRSTRDIQDTIENDEQIGGAIRDIKSALRGEDAPRVIKPLRPVTATPTGLDDSFAAAADATGESAALAAGVGSAAVVDSAEPTVRTSDSALVAQDHENPAPELALIKPSSGIMARGQTAPAAAPVTAQTPRDFTEEEDG
jgi:sec-independent protein translocase protein TatB